MPCEGQHQSLHSGYLTWVRPAICMPPYRLLLSYTLLRPLD